MTCQRCVQLSTPDLDTSRWNPPLWAYMYSLYSRLADFMLSRSEISAAGICHLFCIFGNRSRAKFIYFQYSTMQTVVQEWIIKIPVQFIHVQCNVSGLYVQRLTFPKPNKITNSPTAGCETSFDLSIYNDTFTNYTTYMCLLQIKLYGHHACISSGARKIYWL